MRDYKGYQLVKISASISEDKLKKAVRSGKITFSADDLKGTKSVLVHPTNGKLIMKAQAKGKGLSSMMLAGSDILYDIEFNGSKSIWHWLEDFKNRKAYSWVHAELS
jgi:hypothetical protein